MAGIGGIGGPIGAIGSGGIGAPSLTPAQAPPTHWGWNPLTDFQKATGALGNWVNQNTSIGGLNLGLGSVIETAANIVPGIANLGYQAGKDIATGQGGALVKLGEGVGQGLYHGALDTATDVATAGGLAPWTNATENALGNLPGSYKPSSLLQYARTPGGPGLLGGALNDALNLIPVADAAGVAAKVGDVGAAAAEASDAATLAQKAAVDSGATLDGIQQAKAAAQATSITQSAERLGVDPARIEQRLALIDSVDKAKTLVQSITNPYSPVIKQLGRAANMGEEVVAPGALANEQNTLPSLTPVEQAAQEAGTAETAKAIAQQAQIRSGGPTQTLYRGENLSGAIPEANGSGYWYTDDPAVAREYAGPNGKVQKVEVPDFIAENTQSHSVLDENGNPVAKAYNLERVPHYDDLARNLPPEATTNPTEISSSALEQVPAAYKSFLQHAAPVPKWAQSIVGHLPTPMVNLLQWSDNLRVAHEYKQITRQSTVALGVVAREVENRPEIQALLEKAQQLMTDRIPGVTPSVASDIIGERVKAALVLGPMWEQLEKMRPELDASHPGLVDSILSFHHELPAEYNTPEFRAEIDQLAQPISAMRQAEEARLRGSVFHGERGLPTEGAVTLTKAERDLADRAQKLTRQAIEAEGLARQAEAGPMRDTLTEAAQALKEKAETVSQRIGDSIDKATVGRLGRSGMQKWQPLTEAADRLAKAAEQYPEVEALLEPLPKTFGAAMDFAVDHGFDPTHMPDMTPARVRELVNGTARLGGQPGKEFVSSTRKMRTGALRRANLDDQSVEAIIGGLVHATQEERTNMVVDWIDRAVARPVGPKGEMPEGWVAWDQTRRGMLQTENTAGEEVAAPGVTKMIPKAVSRAIQEYGSTASNPIARAMQMATDPWRFFMLTLNPAFYLHHISGHIMLSLAQEGGFHPMDWVNAYRDARNHFLDLPEVTGQNITQAELKTPGVVTYPDFRTALAQGGKREAANYLTQMTHRVIATSDSFARAVDYYARKREGFTDMEALQHANTALVDYGNLSNSEKTIVRSLIPFYGFQKGILKIALKMPADHPLVTNVLMQIGKWQTENAVDSQGNPLPSGYQGYVKLFGHEVNLKSMSPFKDLGSLTTTAGLVGNLQYGLQAAIHAGLNAPAPFTTAGTQVGPYGQVVPKVTLLSQLGAALSSSPQAQLFNGLQGNTAKGPLASALSFGGFPTTPQATIDKAGARNVLSQAEVVNSTPKQQAQETAFPVDTLAAQRVLEQQAAQPGGPLLPAGVTQTQIMAALAAAQAKQQASAALTRATGVNKMGVRRKATRRKGGGSHRVRAHIHRASTKKGSSSVHVHKIKVSKSALRQSFGKSYNRSAKGGGGSGGLHLKSTIRGVPGLKKKR